MLPLPTPQQMAEADRRAIAGGTPGHVLMERAGRAVARATIRLLGGRYGRRVVVVCGKGNNGGDGFVAARALAAEGLAVRCAYLDDPAGIGGDPGLHRDRFVGAGGRVEPLTATTFERADAVVDAIFGTGFRGEVEGRAKEAIDALNAGPWITVAVDIPSGVDGSTGAAGGSAVRADVTVAIAAQKVGCAVGTGAELAGEVEVADIGIPVEEADAWMTTAADVRDRLPRRPATAHKRSAGSVAVLGGSEGMSGAAILSARGAARMGAGYVTIGLPRSIDPIVSAALPEVLTKVVADGTQLTGDSLVNFKTVVDRADVLAVGPGLGEGDEQAVLMGRVLRETQLPVVVDADGLNVLARDASGVTDREAPTVLTPHPAELARLLQTDTSTVQADRLGAARSAAERLGSIVLLKGFRSVIAEPGGRVVVNTTGSSHLATAGTGDVLTGAIAALIGGGMDPFEATWSAAYVHGIAGEVAAARHEGRGVVAWDVAEALPDAAAVVEDAAWD